MLTLPSSAVRQPDRPVTGARGARWEGRRRQRAAVRQHGGRRAAEGGSRWRWQRAGGVVVCSRSRVQRWGTGRLVRVRLARQLGTAGDQGWGARLDAAPSWEQRRDAAGEERLSQGACDTKARCSAATGDGGSRVSGAKPSSTLRHACHAPASNQRKPARASSGTRRGSEAKACRRATAGVRLRLRLRLRLRCSAVRGAANCLERPMGEHEAVAAGPVLLAPRPSERRFGEAIRGPASSSSANTARPAVHV
jgi:hypothetical protein